MFAFLASFIASSLLAPTYDSNADTNTAETVTADGYTMTLSATSAVNLNLLVYDTDTMTVGLGNVSVETNSPGYRLYIGMTGEATALNGTLQGSSSISGTSGTFSNPAALTRGTWGYAIPSGTPHLVSANHFSSSYTTMDSTTPDTSKLFATPPASSNNPDMFATSTTATPTGGDSFPIYYGIRANADTNPGIYTNNVMFTAVADASANPNTITLTPNTTTPNTATTVIVKTSMYTTADDLSADVYLLTRAQYNSLNGSTNVESLGVSPLSTCTATSTEPLTYSCNITVASVGDYNIFVKSPRYDKAYATAFTVSYPPFTVNISKSNVTTSPTTSISVPYGGSTTVTVTPNSGYYLSAVSCPSGYTCSGYTTGTSAISQQTVTVTNNNTASGGTITFTGTKLDFYNIATMQQMTSDICASATTPNVSATQPDTTGAYRGNKNYVPTKSLVDTRKVNGTTQISYQVRKLADGKCWMTENLKLTNVTITNADSNLPANKSVTIPASSTANWCTTSSQACVDKLMTLTADDGSHPEYGVFYNWYTATATYGGFNTTTDTSYSICPKGWRLPKGGSSGDFANLRNNYYTSSAFGDDWTKFPLNYVLSGYRGGSKTGDQGNYGYYWSSTPSNNNYAYYLYLNNSNVNPTNYSRKYLGFTIRCIAEDDFWTINSMQEMTPEIAATVQTPSSSATTTVDNREDYDKTSDKTTVVPTRTLVDTRKVNGTTQISYQVSKLADGNVWMTENLKLTNVTITNADSNLPANKSVTIPASSTANWCDTYSQACDDQLMTLNADDGSHPEYGVFYNFYTATATYGGYNTTTDTQYSICPKGWRLPKASRVDYNPQGDWANLQSYYTSSAFGDDWTKFPLNYVRSGYRYVSNTRYQGNYGRYWSSTPINNHFVYLLHLDNSGVMLADSNVKYYGFTIRCLAE